MTRFYHSSALRSGLFSEKLLNSFLLVLMSGMMVFMSSCEEDPTKIGEKLLPGTDFVSIYSTDTISVKSYTMYSDSTRSDNPSYSYLGQLYDPYFGTTTAEFVTQVRLRSAWDPDKIHTIDSIKFYMTLLDVKGNINAGHILRLSEISEQIYTDSAYYSNRPVSLTGDSFDIQMPALKADSTNNLVLDLPVAFGNHIIRDTSMLFHDTTRIEFRSYFKGLYFQLIPNGDPAFLTMSVAPTQTPGVYNNFIVLFMHDESGVAEEFYFLFDAQTKNAAFNKYSHDYTTGLTGKKIEHINDGFLDTLTYLQGLNGVYTKIKLPGLEQVKSNPDLKDVAINKARIIYPYWIDDIILTNTSLPSQLLMSYNDNTGTRYYVHDYTTSSVFYNGTPDTVAFTYTFNISNFVQRYLEDTENKIVPEIDLFVPPGSIQKAIMRANGSSKPVKFELTYTKF